MTPYHFTYAVIDRRDFSEKRGAGSDRVFVPGYP